MSKTVTITVPDELLADIDTAAEGNRSEWMRRALAAYLYESSVSDEPADDPVPEAGPVGEGYESSAKWDGTPDPPRSVKPINDHTGHRTTPRGDGSFVCADCNRLVR